jgi:hypothetical protein
VVGHRGLAGRVKKLQHRGIAPTWSCKSPQTQQRFRHKRWDLRIWVGRNEAATKL